MDQNSINRKDFFKKMSVAGLGAVGVTSLISACGGETAKADPCNDLTGLSEADLTMRNNLGYITKTEKPAERCDNCQLYTVPAENSTCGGCLLFKGPVTADGWCNSWVIKQG